MKEKITVELSYKEAVLILMDRSELTHEQLALKIGLPVFTFQQRLKSDTLHEYPREQYNLNLLLVEHGIKTKR